MEYIYLSKMVQDSMSNDVYKQGILHYKDGKYQVDITGSEAGQQVTGGALLAGKPGTELDLKSQYPSSPFLKIQIISLSKDTDHLPS